MALDIFSLRASIDVNNEDAKKAIDDTTKTGESAGKKLATSLGSIASSAIKIGTTIATVTSTIAAAGLASAMDTAEAADEIDKTSQKMNVSTGYFQKLRYAADQSGVSLTNLQSAAKKLEGTDLNLESALNQIMALGTEEERAKAATDLFGKSVAYNLMPILTQSGEEFQGLIDRADELGLVMSEDAVAAGVTFGDTFSDIKQSLSAAKNELTSAFMPVMNELLNIILENMPIIRELIRSTAPIITQLMQTIIPLFMQLVSIILPPLLELINILLPIISQLIETILPIFIQLMEILLPPIIQIVQALLPPLCEILTALMPLLQPLVDILGVFFDILTPIISVLTKISDFISGKFTKVINSFTSVIKGIKDVFSNVFGALGEIVKKPINWIIDGINVFIKGLNKIKIPDWVPAFGGKGLNIPLIKKLRVGLEYVPYDEMPAILHKGEQVLTSEEAREYRQNKNNKNESIINNYTNSINIEKLEVREENDIQRIAEELYYLQKKAEV